MEHKSLEGLNDAQRDAAVFKDGYELILAGAGTGKTKTLTSHVAWLLEEGVDPESILMVTFTNAAANEMKQRIIDFVGEKGEKITAVTFHSLCYSILKQNDEKTGMPGFTLMDEEDAKDVFRMCREERIDELQLQGIPLGAINIMKADRFPNIKAETVYRMCNPEDITNDPDILDILNRYERANREKCRMDFDDLLSYTYRLLLSDEEVRHELDDRYRYIMCDEYQDTDKIQDKILHLLTRDHSNLVVVGDENQSIYKFRGAYIDNILGFMSRHPGAKQVELTTNYRSDQTILNLANAVMIYQLDGDHRDLRSIETVTAMENGQTPGITGKAPILVCASGEKDEAKCTADAVMAVHNEKMPVPYDRIAVLCRSSKPLFRVEEELEKRGINTVMHKGSSSGVNQVIRNIMLMLRISQNCGDDIALTDLMNEFVYGITAPDIRDICERVSENGIQWLISSGCTYTGKSYGNDLFRLGEIINMLAGMSLEDALYNIIEGSFYQELCNRRDYSKMQAGKHVNRDDSEHVQQREDLAKAGILMDRAGQFHSVKEFIESMALNDINLENGSDCVVLSTIHSAKGLEFDAVILIDARDGGIPSEQSIHDDTGEDMAEELRCMYVALTRAKNTLIIIYPAKASISQNPKYKDCVSSQKLSRFLDHDNVRQCMTPEMTSRNLFRQTGNKK